MINDKIVRLPIDAVVQMLDGMSAANIEQIELITTPPAKYEAEGDAGLININMKEHEDLSYNGTIGGNLGYNSAETLGGNFNFSRRGRKVAYFVNYSINYDNNESTWINRRNLQRGGFTELIQSDNYRDPTIDVQNVRLGMEYNLSLLAFGITVIVRRAGVCFEHFQIGPGFEPMPTSDHFSRLNWV